MLQDFTALDSSDLVVVLFKELQRNPKPYYVIRRFHQGDVLWYVMSLEEILERLQHRLEFKRLFAAGLIPDGPYAEVDILSALDLHEHMSTSIYEVPPEMAPGSDDDEMRAAAPIFRGGGLGDATRRYPEARVDPKTGRAYALSTEPIRPSQARLYSRIEAVQGCEYVVPDRIAEYAFILSTKLVGQGAGVNVTFRDNEREVTLLAVVESKHFKPAPNVSWTSEIVVKRDANAIISIDPSEWVIKAVPQGEREAYTFDVHISCNGQQLATVSYTAMHERYRNDASKTPGPSTEVLDVPRVIPDHPDVHIHISQEGKDNYRFRLFVNGVQEDEFIQSIAGMSRDLYKELAASRSLKDVWEKVAPSILGSIHSQLESFLLRHIGTTQITSFGRLAPFECFPILRTGSADELLGIERPVLRCVPGSNMENADIDGTECTGIFSLDWKGIQDQRKLLDGLFTHYTDITSLTELEEHLKQTAKGVFHFSGHATDNPAQLCIGDKYIGPASISRVKYRKLRDESPLFFVNGCLAGSGELRAAAYGDMAAALLRGGFRAVVAPTMEIHASAASFAANVFYEALRSKTIGEAVQAVRSKSKDNTVPEEYKPMLLSYLAFCTPSSKVIIP